MILLKGKFLDLNVPRLEGRGGKSRTPKEAPDNLFSNNIANITDLLSEGEIEGLVGGLSGILYNEVPLLGPNGEKNFTGAIVTGNNGTPDQPALPGQDDVRTTFGVAQDLPFDTYKTVSFPNDGSVTSIYVTLSATNFFEVEKDGDTVGTSVSFVIELSQNGSSFLPAYQGTITGKQKDEVTFDFRFPVVLPIGQTAIRVKRTTPTSVSLKVSNDISFKSYTRVVEHKFSYPNSAVYNHVLDANQFGNKLPTRQYRARGIKCKVPHNYNPSTRAYTGPFNGSLTSTKIYTNNPAWVYYDLVTSKRYGLGQFLDLSSIDIPSLYQVAKWCDDLVPDGFGGMEPRWVCNAYITTRGEAYDVLKELVSCFRGNLFYMQSKLWALADNPKDPVKIVTNANVLEGKFTYSGESDKQRVSVINVAFNDPTLLFRRGIETVYDRDLVRELGLKTKDFGAFGCTTRGQARRLGKAILFAQEFESELVSYKASFDHMAVFGDGPEGIAPGDTILIADRTRGNARAGGRVKSTAGQQVTLDRELTGAGSGLIYVEHALTGLVEWLTCTFLATGVVTLTQNAVQPVATNDLFILIDAGFDPEPFIVLKTKEDGPNILEITAVKFDSRRYAEIYGTEALDPKRYMSLPNMKTVLPPIGPLTFTDGFITGADETSRTLTAAWGRSEDRLLSHYVARYSKDFDEWTELPVSSTPFVKVSATRAGKYRFQVVAVSRAGVESQTVYGEYTVGAVPSPEALRLGTIENPELQSGGIIFSGRDAKIKWTIKTPQGDYLTDVGVASSNTGLLDPNFRDCVVTVKRTNGVALRVESIIDTNYVYTYEKNFEDTGGAPIRDVLISIQYRDIYGRLSPEVSTTISNIAPVFSVEPAVVTALDAYNITYARPTDPDFAGVKVYASLTNPVVTNAGNLRYSGPDTSITLPQIGAAAHYVRVVPYDVFGDGTSSAQQTVQPSIVLQNIADILVDVSALEITYGSTASAAASASAASVFAGLASDANSQVQLLKSQTQDLANAANQSAILASTKATDAGNFSTSAQGFSNTANTRANDALAYSQAAGTSASTAQSLSDLAGTRATSALNSSNAASASAGSANTNALASSGSAASALASKDAAAISSASAASNLLLSVAYSQQIDLTPNSDFKDNLLLWGSNFFAFDGGTPYPVGSARYNANYSGRQGVFVTALGSNPQISGKATPCDPTREYAVSTSFYGDSAGVLNYGGLAFFDVNKTFITWGYGTQAAVLHSEPGWRDLYSKFKGNNSGVPGYIPINAVWMQPLALVNYHETTNNGKIGALDYCRVSDITSQSASAASAAAAQSSAITSSAASASALTSANIAATIGLNSLNAFPTFANYLVSGPAPDGWINAAGGNNYISTPGEIIGRAVRRASAPGVNYYTHCTPLINLEPGQYLNLEASFKLLGGTLKGSGLTLSIETSGQVQLTFINLPFELDINNNTNTILGDGTVNRVYRFSKVVRVPVGLTTAKLGRLYFMEHWSGLGDISSANDIIWYRVSASASTPADITSNTVVPAIQANVSANSGAIVTLQGESRAFWQVEGNAGSGASFFISAQARANYGETPSSNVSFGAHEVHIFNPVGDNWKKALSVINGDVILSGGLQVNTFIRLGTGLGWPVALKAREFLVSDGMTINYETDLGVLPQLDYFSSGLAALGANESYLLYADPQTTTGLIARLKIVTPSTPTNYSKSDHFPSGTGPARQMNITPNPPSTTGSYTITMTGTISIQNEYDPEPPGFYYRGSGSVSIGIYAKKLGVWILTAQETFTGGSTGPLNATSVYSWSRTNTYSLGSGVEAFGIGVLGLFEQAIAATVDSVAPITWAVSNSSSRRSASPNGEQGKITVRPQ